VLLIPPILILAGFTWYALKKRAHGPE
jgi:hypothetical protein